MRSSRNLKEFASPYHRLAINALNDDTKGSCTGVERRWTPWECQSAHIDQDPNQSISLKCHIVRHEASTQAPNKTLEDCRGRNIAASLG
jgi:hypothetical protein